MENITRVRIGNLICERSERCNDPQESEFDRFIGLEHMDTGCLEVTRWGSTDDITTAQKICRAGDILFARRNPYLRRASVVRFDAVCSGDCIVFYPLKDKVVPDYIPIVLGSKAFWEYAMKKQGGTMSKRVRFEGFSDYTFDLPPKEEQERIVRLVWSLEKLSKEINNQMLDLDLLIKSRFVEMFGNPSSSEVYPRVQFCDLVTNIVNGMGSPPEFSNEGFCFIRATNIDAGTINKNEMLHISLETSKKLEKYRVNTGDFIFVRSGAYAGDVAMIPPEYDMQYGAYDINVKIDQSRVNPVYLNVFFNSDYLDRVIRPMTARSAQPHLNTKQVLSLSILLPPKNTQDEFAEFVKQVDKSKFSLQKYLDDTISFQRSIINGERP